MSRLTLPLALVLLVGCSASTTTSGRIGVAPGISGAASDSRNEIWICHGNKKPKWKQVAAPAVDAHRRHGDRVVHTPQRANTACSK